MYRQQPGGYGIDCFSASCAEPWHAYLLWAANLLKLPCCCCCRLLPAGASPEFADLITRLIDKNPATRIKWLVSRSPHLILRMVSMPAHLYLPVLCTEHPLSHPRW